MTAPIPRELAAHLAQIGVVILTPPKPADPRIDDAVKHGVSNGWMPSYPGEEPPF
jgi:hypothetical protein